MEKPILKNDTFQPENSVFLIGYFYISLSDFTRDRKIGQSEAEFTRKLASTVHGKRKCEMKINRTCNVMMMEDRTLEVL